MPVNKMGLTTETLDDGDGRDAALVSFEDKMLARVNNDFKRAKINLRSLHATCLEYYKMYHNARMYDQYTANSKFPISFFPEQIDLAVSEMMDKLFYKNQPCTVVARPNTDKGDADQKQEMIKYQDYEDNMFLTIRACAKDAVQYRMAAAKTDYIERYEDDYIEETVPDGYEIRPQRTLMGMVASIVQKVKQVFTRQKIAVYKGPRTSRVDPVNVFFTQDKVSMNDDEPIMLRSWMAKSSFKKKKYFFNYDDIPEPVTTENSDNGAQTVEDDIARAKREFLNPSQDSSQSQRPIEYVEWQGKVNKKELLTYLAQTNPDVYKAEAEAADPSDETWAICGVANGTKVVRLHQNPFDYDGPNIHIGFIIPEEGELFGGSIADKIIAAQKGMEKTLGMVIENLKQSINAGHVINVNAIEQGGEVDLNEEGFVLRATGRPDDVHRRIEQPRVAEDLYRVLDIYRFYGQNASGFNNLKSAQGDPAAETLGEAQIIANQGNIRTGDYLRTFEASFIIPVYKFRNHINCTFLKEDYRYLILGEGAYEWKKIDKKTIRASTMFICESSSRETNRAVISQQILQLLKVAQVALAAGQPVRIDELIYDLCTTGFSMSKEKSERIVPLKKYENDHGADKVNTMLVENALLSQMVMRMGLLSQLGSTMMGGGMGMGGAPGTPGPGQQNNNGGDIPQPRSEGGAVAANNQRNATNVAETRGGF